MESWIPFACFITILPQESRTERNKQKRLCVTTPLEVRDEATGCALALRGKCAFFPGRNDKNRELTGQREPADGPRGISDDFSARKPYLNNNGSTTPLMIWDVAARQVVTVGNSPIQVLCLRCCLAAFAKMSNSKRYRLTAACEAGYGVHLGDMLPGGGAEGPTTIL